MKAKMIGTTRILRRVIALRNARDKAKNPEFKLIWDLKLKQYMELVENGRSSDDTIH